jgi:hypothetical protein
MGSLDPPRPQHAIRQPLIQTEAQAGITCQLRGMLAWQSFKAQTDIEQLCREKCFDGQETTTSLYVGLLPMSNQARSYVCSCLNGDTWQGTCLQLADMQMTDKEASIQSQSDRKSSIFLKNDKS